MWPQALQLTRDECRGILRRLELESYSQVISVFRAQGGLTETKQKILEDLRGIFHISQERHRGEARRVANDEQLSTIAEVISGPNTWQEWSREGRRSFPMLARVAPQTALALIANNVASDTATENAKLPYPSDTAAAAAEESDALAIAREAAGCEMERTGYVVTSEPFKMPEIPMIGVKKNLKRNLNDTHLGAGGSHKKRNNNNELTHMKYQQQQQQSNHGAHILTHNKRTQQILQQQQQENELDLKRLQQQRFFHHQLQKHKAQKLKSAGKQRQATPAKSGRKSQKQLQKQLAAQKGLADALQQQQQYQQQHQQLQQAPLSRTIPYLGNIVSSGGEPPMLRDSDEAETVNALLGMPQIAASKKDITKNLNKLQLPVSGLSNCATMQHPQTQPPSQQIVQVPAGTMIGVPISSTSSSSSTPSSKPEIIGKQLLSTPVKKYIVEDRQPTVTAASTPPPSPLQQQQQQQQPPQTMQIQIPTGATTTATLTGAQIIGTTVTKLRGVNTTILPPGTKITKKLPASAIISTSSTLNAAPEKNASQPQVFSVADSAGGSTTTILTHNNATSSASQPTHTPPAIIQLHSSGDLSTSASASSSSSVSTSITTTTSAATVTSASSLHPTQGKVLTTKLVPVILSGNHSGVAAAGNGQTTVTTGSSLPAGMGTTIIKNIPATMLLTGGQASGSGANSGTIISTIGPSGTTVFRKAPNFMKTGIIGVNATNSTPVKLPAKSDTPHIISTINLKTDASVDVSGTLTTTKAAAAAAAAQQMLQQQYKNLTTTGLRASVQIRQSVNGKVIIQSAGSNVVDGSKLKIQTTNLNQAKLLGGTILATSSAGSATTGVTTPSVQRFNIQKVEIIQGPASQHQQQQQHNKSTTFTIGNKANMIFMPASAGRVNAASFVGTKMNIVAKAPELGGGSAKPNVVVIGTTTMATSPTQPPTKTHTLTGHTPTSSSITLKSPANSTHKSLVFTNQMITEDTPMDILNMPIIVDDGGSAQPLGGASNILTGGGNNIGDTVTMLPSSLIETSTQPTSTTTTPLTTTGQKNKTVSVFSGATDWEMELDQATAASSVTKVQKHIAKASLPKDIVDESNTIEIDDNYDDVIIEDQETMDSTITTNDNQNMETTACGVQKTSQPTNDIIIIDNVDDDKKSPLMEHSVEDGKRLAKQQQPSSSEASVATKEPLLHEHTSEDAGFDETIEVDENTAIEYIELDQQQLSADESEDPQHNDEPAPEQCVKTLDDDSQNSAVSVQTFCRMTEKTNDDRENTMDELAAHQDAANDGENCVNATPTNAVLIA